MKKKIYSYIPKIAIIIFTWLSISSFTPIWKQVGSLESLVTIDLDNTTVEKVLDVIRGQTGLVFSYSPSIIDCERLVSCHVQQKPVRYVLNYLFGNTVTVKQRDKFILLVKNKTDDQNDKIFIEGYVTDPNSGQRLSEVTVYNKELKASAVTNQYGYFKIELEPIKPITELRVCKSGFSDTIIAQSLKTGFVDINLQSVDSANTPTGLKKWIPKYPIWLVPNEILVNAMNIKNDSILGKSQISFLPFIGTNQFLGGTTVNDYSFNILAGYTESVRKFELGGCFNFVRKDAGMCQIAGIGNVVGGSTNGIQAAGVYNLSRENNGLQLAGTVNVGYYNGGKCQLAGIGNITRGMVNGFQGAGYFNIAKEVNGVQLTGIFNYSQILSGFQISGIGNFANRVTGTQVSGAINICPNYTKNQFSGIANFADTVEQTQISGLINITGEINGLQLSGIINAASSVKGAQISLFNFADSCSGISIGLLSIIKKGYHRFEVFADELIYLNLSYKLGVSKFYNIFNTGISPGAKNLVSFGYGFGTLLGKSEKRKLNFELTSNNINELRSINFKNQVTRLYCGIDRRISSRVSVVYGISLNVFQTDESDQQKIDQFEKNIPYTFLNSDLSTKMWIGGRLGLRF